MIRPVRVAGLILVVLSVLAVIQTAREVALWTTGARAYAEEDVLTRTFAFGGHTFSVTDDQSIDPVHSQAASAGRIQPLMDGHPLGPPSAAQVRRGLTDLGRYHLWFSAWIFRDQASGQRTLWLARRLQPTARAPRRFEVITIDSAGHLDMYTLRPWQLGTDYRRYRATQYLRDGTWSVFPLALGDVAGLFPLLLLVFPVGTFITGVVLARRGAQTHPSRAAV